MPCTCSYSHNDVIGMLLEQPEVFAAGVRQDLGDVGAAARLRVPVDYLQTRLAAVDDRAYHLRHVYSLVSREG